MRNSFGALTSPQLEREYMRNMFWWMLRQDFRYVLEDLGSEPFEVCCSVDGRAGDPLVAVAIKNWQHRYNLFEDSNADGTEWILDQATFHVRDWYFNSVRGLSEFHEQKYLMLPQEDLSRAWPAPNPPIGFPGFTPRFETVIEYVRSVQLKTRETLNNTPLLTHLSPSLRSKIVSEMGEKAEKYGKQLLLESMSDPSGICLSKDVKSRKRALRWALESCLQVCLLVDRDGTKLGESEVDVATRSREKTAMFKLLGLAKPAHLKGGRPPTARNKH